MSTSSEKTKPAIESETPPAQGDAAPAQQRAKPRQQLDDPGCRPQSRHDVLGWLGFENRCGEIERIAQKVSIFIDP